MKVVLHMKNFSYIAKIWSVLPMSSLKLFLCQFLIIVFYLYYSEFLLYQKSMSSTWSFSEKGHH